MTIRLCSFALLSVLSGGSTACEEESCRADVVDFSLPEPDSVLLLVGTLSTVKRDGGAASVHVTYSWPQPLSEASFGSVVSSSSFAVSDGARDARLELRVHRLDRRLGRAVQGEAEIAGAAVGGCSVSLEVVEP